ncbi:hypothetical protein [Proteiniphilum sp. X52]|uniref:hypothetical protein n=1 Tax=Proteiniphilum sp. X52 TaxID=2382159 RepID=UPI000F09D6A6|nr:hypothetical protein [Proteiniphilum sp. X52]
MARTAREIPIVYLVVLLVFALSTGWFLLKADIAVTGKSLSVAAMLQLLVCTRLKYPDNKKELLSQYPKLYPTIFALPPAALMLPLFPSEWPAIALSFLSILLVSLNVLWIKYIFYPSMVLASLFFFVGIAVQAALAISQYGLALIPLYHLGLYHFFKRRTYHCFTENERTDY